MQPVLEIGSAARWGREANQSLPSQKVQKRGRAKRAVIREQATCCSVLNHLAFRLDASPLSCIFFIFFSPSSAAGMHAALLFDAVVDSGLHGRPPSSISCCHVVVWGGSNAGLAMGGFLLEGGGKKAVDHPRLEKTFRFRPWVQCPQGCTANKY